MTAWSEIAAIWLSLDEVRRRDFLRLHSALEPSLNPRGPYFEVFAGLPSGTAGSSISVAATRTDGRALWWGVEVWIQRDDPRNGGGWFAVVKGEIDLDDAAGDDRCVVNEQESVVGVDDAVALIRRMAGVVCRYPVDQLLTMRWEDVDHASPA